MANEILEAVSRVEGSKNRCIELGQVVDPENGIECEPDDDDWGKRRCKLSRPKGLDGK